MLTSKDRVLANHVLELRAGRLTAADALMRALNQPLFRLARSVTGDDAEAEDIVQEAFVRAFTSLDKLKNPTAFRSWITRIAYIEALRRSIHRKHFVSLEAWSSGGACADKSGLWTTDREATQPDEQMHRRQVGQLIEKAVDSLPPKFRVVFVLREVEGLSVEETALQLDVRPETVRTRHHRARAILRSHIANECQQGLSELFAFAGERCTRTRARVMVRLTHADLRRH